MTARCRARRTGRVGADLVGAMNRAIVSARDWWPPRSQTPTNTRWLSKSAYGLILALHYEARFLQKPGSIEPPTRASKHPGALRCALHIPTFFQQGVPQMPTYNPPLRDMQFVMHEVLQVVDDLKQIPKHADVDADTINAVLEEGVASSPPR